MKTVCKGDSGGALLCNINGKITFSGVLSRTTPYEDNCGSDGHPGVFVDLFYYSQWIQENNNRQFTLVVLVVRLKYSAKGSRENTKEK